MSEEKKQRWHNLAEQASKEEDPVKLLQLTKELSKILDEEEDRLKQTHRHSA